MIIKMLQSVRRSYPLILAGICLLTVIPGLFLSFEDSEIWGITSSRRIIDNPFVVTSAHYKPLFSLMFGTIASLAKSDWSALIGARWLALSFAAGGLFSLYSIGLLGMSSNRRRLSTILFYVLICTMPLFIVHFPKARSDSMSASLVLLTGFILMLFETKAIHWRGVIFTAGSAFALLVTPKSIDLIAALGAVFWAIDVRNREIEIGNKKSSAKLRRLVWLTGPVVGIFLIALVFSREFLIKSLTYWLDTFKGVDPLSALTWVSVTRAVETAPVVSLVLAVGLIAGLIGFRRLSNYEKAFVIAGWIVIAFIAIHSQKYFFFLSSRVPFLALGALPGFHLIAQAIASRFSPRTVTVLVTALLLASTILTARRLYRYPGFNFAPQKQTYLQLENFLDRSRAHWYWDAIGLFPTRNLIFHYPSPGDRTNSDLLDFVEMSRPTLILRTSKMELLEPSFMMWLKPRYVRITDEILVRYVPLTPNETCTYSGRELLKNLSAEKLVPPIVLVSKPIAPNSEWSRQRIHTIPQKEFDAIGEKAIEQSEIVIEGCKNPEIVFALTEAGPWEAMPAPYFSQFFGYDGRL